jgi:hypothetical protein
LGEHNREVLSGVLGCSTEQIDDLYRQDVLYEAPEVQMLPEELKKYDSDQGADFNVKRKESKAW